jgi:uncharacterized protein YkwD
MRMSRSRRAQAAVVVCAALALQAMFVTPAHAVTTRERRTYHLINKSRWNHDRRSVKISSYVSKLAHSHSRKMANLRTYFHHCLSCLMSRYGWSYVGENVGYASTVRRMHRWFMHSSTHRANILCRCFTRVGVGVVRSGGYVWVTEIFYRP